MNMRTDRPTHAEVETLNALSNLIDTARAQMLRRSDDQTRARLRSIVAQLDAARTRLVQDGDEYIEVAWSFLDAGRDAVAIAMLRLDNIWKEHTRAGA